MIGEIAIEISIEFDHFVAELFEKFGREKAGDAVSCVDDEFEFFGRRGATAMAGQAGGDVVEVIVFEVGGSEIAFVNGNIKIFFWMSLRISCNSSPQTECAFLVTILKPLYSFGLWLAVMLIAASKSRAHVAQ